MAIMIGIGVLFTIMTGAFQLTHFTHIFTVTFGQLFKKHDKNLNGISPFKAMSAALAGTVGTGNIIGVATAISLGGAGAIFWMWVSAALGMMTKFAEVTLAVKYREQRGTEYVGGPMYYITNGMGKQFKPLACVFSFFCICASFGIGNMTQANSIAVGATNSSNINPLLVGIVVAALSAVVIIGGVNRITNFTGLLVPFMSVFYIAGCVIIIYHNRAELEPALVGIFSGAFSPQKMAGGVAGFTVATAIRTGFSRGVFSNEAGLGSAPIVHACASTKIPARQGCWGAAEVFIDTLLICTITALVILTSHAYITGSATSPETLTAAAFSEVFGRWGVHFVSISSALFAFATIVSWSLYGQRCCEYLFAKQRQLALQVYKIVYIAFIIIGATSNLAMVWSVSDTLNGLMAIPNLIALVALSPVVIREVKNYKLHIKKDHS